MRTIEQTIKELYECISFKKGETPKLEKLKELFTGEGILINNGMDKPLSVNVASFIEAYKTNIAKGIFPTLQGRELSHKMDLFGKIAQRFSVYEFAYEGHVSLGINSIQLIQIDGSWYITSMVWCDQNEKCKIPEEYLASAEK